MFILNDVHIDVQCAEMGVWGYAMDRSIPTMTLCPNTEQKRKKQDGNDTGFFHGILSFNEFLGNLRARSLIGHRINTGSQVTDIYPHLPVAHLLGENHAASHVGNI